MQLRRSAIGSSSSSRAGVSQDLLSNNWIPASGTIFVLYQAGVSIGVYKTPMEALARINDDDLTRKYLSVIAEPASLALRSADVGFMLRAGSIIRPEAPQEFLRYARRRRAPCGEKRPGFPTAAG
ncbi:MAG: hypothetical protein JWQ23_3003 [Herminiimonas sp.]|nr:hypothetical protein [Herminiimonas sp.]